MDANERLNKAIRDVVETQLRNLDPPETKETFDRLIAAELDTLGRPFGIQLSSYT